VQYGGLEGEALMYGEYTCLDCGKTFDDPKRWEERHGLDSPPYEDFSGCPYCGGAYTRTILCDACGEPIVGDYVKIQTTGDCYCDECFMMKSLGEDDP
jgi:DNA-directed RNA polymerase subunit RPC12/RpoP